MASFSAGTTFTDGVANDVTAAKLAALVNAATPTSGFIQDRTAESTIAADDTLLFGDFSDSSNLKRMTVANFTGTLPTATITTLNSTTGTITTLNSTTGTITTLNSTTGTIATLNSTTGTIATLNSTTGTIATLNSTTGTIPTLVATTLITTGTGTAAAPAIVPTGDTNTGIFFPAADTIALSEGGAEAMRIDSSGQVGIGTASPSYKLQVTSNTNDALISASGAADNIGLRVSNTQTGGKAYRILAPATGSGYAVGGLVFEDQAVGARMTIDSSGNVGVGTNAPDTRLHVGYTSAAPSFTESAAGLNLEGSSSVRLLFGTDPSSPFAAWLQTSNTGSPFPIALNPLGGNVGIGTASPTQNLDIQSATASVQIKSTTATNSATLKIENNSTAYIGNESSSVNTLFLGTTAYATCLGNSGAYPVQFATNNNVRMTIDSSGNVLVGKATTAFSTAGVLLSATGCEFVRDSQTLQSLNRLTNDGTLVNLCQDGTVEGTISVSGTTVSYNGGHLSRFSQLPSGQRDPAIKKGTVLSNLDAMCEWRDADGNLLPNEQLNKVKISDVEGDSNTAGVFVNWDNDDQDNPYDLNMAMTGDMIIRIAQGTSVNRGDLLISAGDGTAKPQGDEIIRSKTIAKVTSTNVTCTYEDGSYCVPCVLMAC